MVRSDIMHFGMHQRLMGGLVAYGSMNGHSAITWIHVRSITEISWINVRTINEFSQTPNTWSNHSPVV